MYPTKGVEIKVFKTKNFIRWVKKEKITDAAIKHAIYEIQAGLVDADLGGGLIKKRIARAGQGKRGGYGVLLAFRNHDRSIFVFGFSKSDRGNLDTEEKEIYKKMTHMYLEAPMNILEKMCVKGQLAEVYYEKS